MTPSSHGPTAAWAGEPTPVSTPREHAREVTRPSSVVLAFMAEALSSVAAAVGRVRSCRDDALAHSHVYTSGQPSGTALVQLRAGALEGLPRSTVLSPQKK